MLRNRLPGRADRSGLRRSTIVRRFFDDLLHGPRAGVVVCPGSRRRDSRLSARFAQTVAQSALCLLAKCFALFEGVKSLFSLPRTLAPIHPLDADVWLARSAGGAAAHAAFSHQSPAGRAQNVYDPRLDERVPQLSLSMRRKTRLRTDRDV